MVQSDASSNSTLGTVRDIVESVPIYKDMAQPAARELGKGLETVAKVICTALEPLRLMVWGYEKIRDAVTNRLAEKLKDVPIERIQTPPLYIVGPTLEALRFAGHDASLRELFATLIATSLDSSIAQNAHPAFVEMIKNMSSDEARIMRLFSRHLRMPLLDVIMVGRDDGVFRILYHHFSIVGEKARCDHPKLTESYLENLNRLGLIRLPDQSTLGRSRLSKLTDYDELKSHPEITKLVANFAGSSTHELRLIEGYAEVTAWGDQFCRACVSLE